VAFGLATMKTVPFKARHLPAFLFICLRTLLSQIAVLLRVFLARATLYHGVEFLFDHLAACYVHLSSLPVMAHGVVFPKGPRCVATIATVATLRSISGI
jgi:hypothetical protein